LMFPKCSRFYHRGFYNFDDMTILSDYDINYTLLKCFLGKYIVS